MCPSPELEPELNWTLSSVQPVQVRTAVREPNFGIARTIQTLLIAWPNWHWYIGVRKNGMRHRTCYLMLLRICNKLWGTNTQLSFISWKNLMIFPKQGMRWIHKNLIVPLVCCNLHTSACISLMFHVVWACPAQWPARDSSIIPAQLQDKVQENMEVTP